MLSNKYEHVNRKERGAVDISMTKINLFKTRIVIEDKVYLLAKDVGNALGFENIERLQDEYNGIIKHILDMPALVLESDFNSILVTNINAMKELNHIEITRVETLRNSSEALKSIYPLKFMMAGKMFEIEAMRAGYQNVNEYIEEVDFAREIEKAKDDLVSKRDLIECINRSREQMSEIIDLDVLRKNNLEIQQYIHIKDCTPYLESFIVGRGVFFSVYNYGYAFDKLRIENDDLIIPTYDYDEDDTEKNFGHDPDMRDFRMHGCLENILYLITHKDVDDAGVDLMCCNAPGISFYISQAEVIKLLNPNMYRNIMLIDGDVDFDYSKMITQDPSKKRNGQPA